MDKKATNAYEDFVSAAKSGLAGLAFGLPIGIIPALLNKDDKLPGPDDADSDVPIVSSSNDMERLEKRIRDRLEENEKSRKERLADAVNKTSSAREKRANENGDNNNEQSDVGEAAIDIGSSALDWASMPLGVILGIYAGNSLVDIKNSVDATRENEDWQKRLERAYMLERLSKDMEDTGGDPFSKYSSLDKDAGFLGWLGDTAKDTGSLLYGVPALLTSIAAYKYFKGGDPERKKMKILKSHIADLRRQHPHTDPSSKVELSDEEENKMEDFFVELNKSKQEE